MNPSFDAIVRDTAHALTNGVPLREVVAQLLQIGAGKHAETVIEVQELEALYRLEDKGSGSKWMNWKPNRKP